jgi:hypothetical protein
MTGTNDQTSAGSSHGGTDRRPPPRPHTPATAQPEAMVFDQHGTMYAPTSLSMVSSFYIVEACPMSYERTAEDTWLVFGDTNLELSLLISDKALVNVVRVATRALREVIRTRGHPEPDLAGREPD